MGDTVTELQEINLVSLQQPERSGWQLKKFKQLDQQRRKVQALFRKQVRSGASPTASEPDALFVGRVVSAVTRPPAVH